MTHRYVAPLRRVDLTEMKKVEQYIVMLTDIAGGVCVDAIAVLPEIYELLLSERERETPGVGGPLMCGGRVEVLDWIIR